MEPPPSQLQRTEEEIQELYKQNKLRVQFQQPTVKHIVSPHSSSILAEPDPTITLEPEFESKCTSIFTNMSQNETIHRDQLPEILLKLGFDSDKDTLPKLVEEYYDSSQSDSLDNVTFMSFIKKFYAPSYYYGERLRRNVCRGQAEMVVKLLVRGCDVNCSDGEGTSPLHYCCEFNRPDLIELLAKIGKKRLVINAKDRYGWSPLHSAAHQGNKQCVQLLIKLGADVNIVDNVGKSPMHIAVAQNRGAVVELLLAAKGNINLQDSVGMTPLHEAAYRGQFTLYSELSQKPTVDKTIRDVLGNLASDYLDDSH